MYKFVFLSRRTFINVFSETKIKNVNTYMLYNRSLLGKIVLNRSITTHYFVFLRRRILNISNDN